MSLLLILGWNSNPVGIEPQAGKKQKKQSPYFKKYKKVVQWSQIKISESTFFLCYASNKDFEMAKLITYSIYIYKTGLQKKIFFHKLSNKSNLTYDHIFLSRTYQLYCMHIDCLVCMLSISYCLVSYIHTYYI